MTDSTLTSSSRKPAKRSLLRRLLAVLALIVLLVIAAILYMVQFDSGTALLWRTATSLSQGSLSGTYVKGNLRNGILLRDVRYKDATTDVQIDEIDGGWDLGLFKRYLNVTYLHVGTVDVALKPTPPTESSGLPDKLTLPFSVELADITLKQLRLDQNGSVTELSDLSLQGSSDKQQHNLTLNHLDTPFGKLVANVDLNGNKPFAIKAKATLDGAYDTEKYLINTELSGALEDLHIALTAGGDKLNGTANIHATPFATLPLKEATIDIRHINPHVFGDGLPVADINIAANLKPHTDSAAIDAPLTLAGDIAIINQQAGALDKQLLPLVSAKANLVLNTVSQNISNLNIQLVNNASLTGGGTYYPAATATQPMGGTFAFNVRNLNLQAIHNTLKPSQLNGPLTVALTEQDQKINLALKDKVFDIRLDALMNAQEIRLDTVRLAANHAVLDVQGAMQKNEAMSYAFAGTLRRFDPAFWMQGGKQGAMASINMDFNIKGATVPVSDVQVGYQLLPNSIFANMPASGKGQLHIVGTELRPSEATLSVADNHINIKGSYGRSNDSIKANINAQHLDRLGYGIAGTVKLDALVKGSPAALTIDADYAAHSLKFAGIALETLTGQTDIKADLNKGLASPGNKLSSTIYIERLQSPYANLERLDLNLSGTSAQHTFTLATNGQVSGTPLKVDVAASGKLFAVKDSYGWDGVITRLESQGTANGLPKISLASPLALRAAADDIRVGATRLLLGEAVLDLKQFIYQQGSVTSQGTFTALHLANVQTLLKNIANIDLPIRTNLIIDSAWDFALKDKASGYIQVARREGDISIASGSAFAPMALSELKSRIDFKQTHLLLDTLIDTPKIGRLTATGQVDLIKQKNLASISPNSRVALQAKLDLPNLAGVGNFLGPQVSLRGKLNAQLNIAGTVDHPKLSGAVNGDTLSFTLLDQGIQLQDGTIRAVLDNNILSVDRFEFAGGKGTLKMSGQVKLDESNGDMQAKVVADKLQIFASADRQLMLSGEATLANINDHLRLNGNVTIDKALFDMPKDSAPELGSDVVIIDRNNPSIEPEQRPASKFAPTINITVNLGNNFRFKGSGADLTLAGNLAVTREIASVLRSNGTLEARGTYEAFGVKLNIERGLINFQGPLTNPSLNILAMRRNQEVEAGVEVTGNANQPRIRLVSEPTVSDEEKLSWLMFSRGSDSSNIGEIQATTQALSFLGNFGGKKIAQEFGFDQFSIGSSESGLSSEQVVNIGKTITQKIMFGVEKALTGPDSVAKLTWNMSRRWSLVVRGGTINGLNVLFNVRYD